MNQSWKVAIVFCATIAFTAPSADAVTLFSRTFDADDSANWIVNDNGLGTNAVDFNFDYSTVGIPPAPGSSGTTLGMKIAANLDSATQPATASQIPAITVSPIGYSFTGDYRLTFDTWSNYIGPLNVGATGSTMLGYAGIGSSGTGANYPGRADGIWFATSGDGQSSSDYRMYSPERPTSYDIFPASGNPLDAHASYEAGSRNQTAALYTSTFPAGATAPGVQASMATQTLSTPAGAFGFRWHAVEIEKLGNIVTWTINGVLIGTVDSSSFGVPLGGNNIFFGYSDTNNTTNANAALLQSLQFQLFDNVVVSSPFSPSGDYNNDGFIDNLDYNVWREQYGQSGPSTADGNGDGVVDAADYTVWRDAMPAVTSAIPEPGSCALVAGLLACMPGVRRRLGL